MTTDHHPAKEIAVPEPKSHVETFVRPEMATMHAAPHDLAPLVNVEVSTRVATFAVDLSVEEALALQHSLAAALVSIEIFQPEAYAAAKAQHAGVAA